MYVFLKWKDLGDMLILKSTSSLVRYHIFSYNGQRAVNLKVVSLQASSWALLVSRREELGWAGKFSQLWLNLLSASFSTTPFCQLCHPHWFLHEFLEREMFSDFLRDLNPDALEIVELSKAEMMAIKAWGCMKDLWQPDKTCLKSWGNQTDG